MAHKTLFNLPVNLWLPAPAGLLVAGDVAAKPVRHQGRFGWQFPDTEERAIVTPYLIMPQGDGGFAGGTLNFDLHLYSASANALEVNFELYVEALTPNTDTLDLEAANSFAALNDIVHTLAGTAGDPRMESITVSNNDGVAAGDTFRLGLRRDADDATNDDASGDIYVSAGELWETV